MAQPRMGEYTGLALAAHIGSITRFPNSRSLSNYFGITPGCRNSGESDRPGSITKAGHPFIRFLLGQLVLHALRGDPGLRRWYRRVKHRRGSKVARVAVMRRLCESIWQMLSKKENYLPVDDRGDEGNKPAGRAAAYGWAKAACPVRGSAVSKARSRGREVGSGKSRTRLSERGVVTGRSMRFPRRSYPSVLVNSWCPMDSACSLGRLQDVRTIGVAGTEDSRMYSSVGSIPR